MTSNQVKAMKYGTCPFPDCKRHPLPGKSPHGFCIEHEKFVADLLFILPHIKLEPQKTKTGLVLPGSPGFQAVPEAVIKQEIEKHGSIKP